MEIQTYDLAVSGHDHTQIPGSYSAKMSIPYAAAAGLLYGRAGLQEFTEEAVQKPEIQNLTKKINVSADRALSDAFPKMQTAIVTLYTASGAFTKRVDYPKGEPENPLSDAEFAARYEDLMAYAGVKQEVSRAVYSAVYGRDVLASELIKAL